MALHRNMLVKYLLLLSVIFQAIFGFSKIGLSAQGPGIFTDRAGETITLTSAPKRILITCYGGASHEIQILGGRKKIIGHPAMERFPLFLKMFPELTGKPDAGSFDEINIEYVMTLKPDLVVASISSAMGNKRIKKLGIPLVTVGTGWTNIELLLKEFTMMGKILGDEKKAAELVAFWNDKLSIIRQRTSSLSDEQSKTVYYCSAGMPWKTEGSIGWGQNYIEAAGGKNISEELKVSGTVTPEQLLLWDPDVIIAGVNKFRSPGNRMQELLDLASLSAVKNKAIYYCPIGAFWWDRPSPEAILGILWLSKKLYPDLMSDINLQEETKNFYKEFYHYALTSNEYMQFLK